MNLFQIAYKVSRTDTEIFEGFGFKHHSDATQYYVHANNQAYDKSTTLCQPIGEAITLARHLVCSMKQSGTAPLGDVWFSDDRTTAFMLVNLPDKWRDEEVVEENVYTYRVLIKDHELTLGAYDQRDAWIDDSIRYLQPLYKLLPLFAALLLQETQVNAAIDRIFQTYVDHPAADVFVNLHEDFYQNHKADDYDIAYENICAYDVSGMHSYFDSYDTIRHNKEQSQSIQNLPLITFADDAFTAEQKMYIPSMGKEFELPAGLDGVCNEIAVGDAQAVLLHGPAGTGKTISCKLMCQSIGLPLMATVNCTENLDEFILGKYIPQDGDIIFKESYVTKAIREGGAVVFEEINFAKPQYLAFLNSLLDDNGFVRLDNGEVVRRHPNFRFFATMNVGYYGTRELNQALYNRFNAIVEIAALSDQAIARMLSFRVPECVPVLDKMLSVYHKIKGKVEREELDVVISPRNLENWAHLAKQEGYVKAAEKTIVPVARCDRSLEEAIRGIIVMYKW